MNGAPTHVLDGVERGIFVAGKWRPASDGQGFSVVDPSTADTIATVASASPDDAVAAADAAAAALGSWRQTPPRDRSEVLRRAFEAMTARKEEIATLISLENGKALPDARAETAYAAEFFRWFAEEAVRLDGDLYVAPSGAYRIVVEREPIGVAALVTPWNYPAAMATRKIAPALAAGCT
ncbi:MAG: aldehyde dehydrogenase family protein, partial [Bifidobacteriaceae bacterium]|nr:aldehyde dehydrogenase family protein [Bifidobacteriaceae bacterium]